MKTIATYEIKPSNEKTLLVKSQNTALSFINLSSSPLLSPRLPQVQRASLMPLRPVNVMNVVVANVEESIGHLPQPPPRGGPSGALGRVGYHRVGHYFPCVQNNTSTLLVHPLPSPPISSNRPG